jgi:hypothetical protein
VFFNGVLGDTALGVGDKLAGLTVTSDAPFSLQLPVVNTTGPVDLRSPSITFLNDLAAQSIKAEATAGDLTINAGKTLTASGAGDALVLAASGNFVNNAGAGALATPSGRWLVYSTSPAGSTENGLTAAAGSAQPRLYNRTYAANGPGTITQPGNHLVYSFQPTLNVTADAANRPYGAADPLFTFSVSGLFADAELADTVTGAGFAGALGSTAVVNSPVAGSPYAITQGTLVSGAGYAINYTGANLTLTQGALTVTADNKVKFLNDPNPPFTATFTGLAPGEGPGNLTGMLAFRTTATQESSLGSYPVTPFGLSSPNYVISFVDGVLVVRPNQPPENAALITAMERSLKTLDSNIPPAGLVQGCRQISGNFFDCR